MRGLYVEIVYIVNLKCVMTPGFRGLHLSNELIYISDSLILTRTKIDIDALTIAIDTLTTPIGTF